MGTAPRAREAAHTAIPLPFPATVCLLTFTVLNCLLLPTPAPPLFAPTQVNSTSPEPQSYFLHTRNPTRTCVPALLHQPICSQGTEGTEQGRSEHTHLQTQTQQHTAAAAAAAAQDSTAQQQHAGTALSKVSCISYDHDGLPVKQQVAGCESWERAASPAALQTTLCCYCCTANQRCCCCRTSLPVHSQRQTQMRGW
jgi:hypothetical protein